MKRKQKTVLKALDRVMDEARGNGTKQEQPTRLKKVHLEQDEFTEHKTIEGILVDFIQEARHLEDHYQGHRKRMIQTVALAIADELTKIGKTDLISQISTVLLKHLKYCGIKWNAIYLRRVLDERYKDPKNRLNALARQAHPGVPQDTDKTAEQLEAELNRKPRAVKKSINYVKRVKFINDAWAWRSGFYTEEQITRAKTKVTLDIPVIVTWTDMGNDAIVTIDEERLNAQIKKASALPVKEWSEEKDQQT